MQFMVIAILSATVSGPVSNPLADEEVVLAGALAIRARAIEAATGFRFDAGWQPKARFEYLSRGQGRHAAGQYEVATGDVLIALALWSQFNIDLGKPLRLATPEELEATEAFRDIADHELGHALADQVSRRSGLGPWFTEEFKESLKPPESLGLNVVTEGVGTYFQNGGRPEYPGMSGEGWFPSPEVSQLGYSYEIVAYRGGGWLVYDVLHLYGERGLIWLIAHPFSAGDNMRADAIAHRERALRELAESSCGIMQSEVRMSWMSDADRRQNARECLTPDIDRHPLGRQLTPEARARAIEHAVDSWKGNTTAGAAAEQGIRHVTGDIIKQK